MLFRSDAGAGMAAGVTGFAAFFPWPKQSPHSSRTHVKQSKREGRISFSGKRRILTRPNARNNLPIPFWSTDLSGGMDPCGPMKQRSYVRTSRKSRTHSEFEQLRNLLRLNKRLSKVHETHRGLTAKVPPRLNLTKFSKIKNAGSRPAEGRLRC